MIALPTLIIGLGGSGGKVVARLKNLIQQNYAGTPQQKSLVQYLVLDCDQFQKLDPITTEMLFYNEGNPRARENEFLFLTGFNPREAYRAYRSDPQSMKDLSEWFPSDGGERIPDRFVDDGASRDRLLGRFYLYHRKSEIEQALEGKIQDCWKNSLDVGVPTNKMRVLIFSSCCGGTGSSSFLDVLYLVQHNLRRKRSISPEVEAVIMLPTLFVNEAVKYNPGLEDYLNANAFAFFREIDLYIKEPNRFNAFALDKVTQNRTVEGEMANGLPANMPAPLGNVYLIDNAIQDYGEFKTLEEMFDFTARAVFYAHFVDEVIDLVKTRISNTDAFKDLDSLKQRPLRYAALGCAEIRYPSELILKYCQFHASFDGILKGLIGEGYNGRESHLKETSGQLINEILEGIVRTFDGRLKVLKDQALGDLVDRRSFLNRKGNDVDWDHTQMETLQGAVKAMKMAAENGRHEMDRHYHEQLQPMLSGFNSILTSTIDTLSGYQGLDYLHEVLRILNNHLESAISDWDQKRTEPATPLDEQIDKILKKERKSLERLNNFMRDVHNECSQELEAHKAVLVQDLLRRMAGAPGGREAVLLQYDERGERFLQGTETQRGILDELSDQISRLRIKLENAAGKNSNQDLPENKMRRFLQILGNCPTTQYVPDYFGSGNWAISNEILVEYYAQFPGFKGDNNADRQKKRSKFLEEFLPELRESLHEQLSVLIGKEDWLPYLRDALENHVLARVGPILQNQDVLQILDSTKGKIVQDLHLRSNLALRMKMESYTSTVDRKNVQSLMFFGSSHSSKTKSMQPDNAVYFKTTADKIVELRIAGIFPYWICPSILSLEPGYYSRQKGNRPHLTKEFNRGELDSMDRPGLSMPSPYFVFFKMYAASIFMKDTKLSVLPDLNFDEAAIRLHRLPLTFIFQEPEKGLHAMLWKRNDKRVLVPGRTSPVWFAKTFSDLEERSERVRDYVRQKEVLQNHIELVEIFESNPKMRQFLKDACSHLAKKYDTYLEELRASEDYALFAEKNLNEEKGKVLRSNENFFIRCITDLRKIVESYSPIEALKD